MDALKPGCLCYLVRLVEMASLTGRVVVVVAPAADEPGWYSISGDWLVRMFTDRHVMAHRMNLLPIRLA